MTRYLVNMMLLGIPGGVPAETAEKHKDQHEVSHAAPTRPSGETKPVAVFFGGETGTCESLAQTLQEKGSESGLDIEIQKLDSATEGLAEDRPNIIITSSYEGHPPANAKKFVSWLEHLDSNSGKLAKVEYAVFGVGNSDWASTFHRIPKLCDKTMANLGGERITEAGFSDVKNDLVGPWEEWSANLIQALSGNKETTANSSLEVTIEASKIPQTLGGDDIRNGTVISNTEIADTTAGPAKRHMVRISDSQVVDIL
jgi:cytochrome P450 / NADPH-cytochrome P450 reductase